MNDLNNFDKTDSQTSSDDLIRFWRSVVRCQGHSRPSRCSKDIHVDAAVLKSIV